MGGMRWLLLAIVIAMAGCGRFHAMEPLKNPKGLNLWPLFRYVTAEDGREIQILWPIFKYQRSGREGLMRIWPLLYHREGPRVLGIARYKVPTDEIVGSDVFSLMEDSWEGQLSSIALSSMLNDDYSRVQSFLHPSILMIHLEDNQEYWPQGRGSQPSGIYSLLLPWWFVDYVFSGMSKGSFSTRYFPPIVGYDSYTHEFKLLNLYFRKYQMDMLPPLTGFGLGDNSHTYVWPIFSTGREKGERHTRLLWRSFQPDFKWTPGWVREPKNVRPATDSLTNPERRRISTGFRLARSGLSVSSPITGIRAHSVRHYLIRRTSG